MIQTMSKNALMLGAFAIVTTAMIGLTHSGTEQRILVQQQKNLLRVLNEVVPENYHDNVLFEDCTVISAPELGPLPGRKIYRARLNGQDNALAIEATAPDGYSGNIHMVIGVDTGLNVLGVRVVEHKETPGLGDKIELAVSDWIHSFSGKSFDAAKQTLWQVKKDGGQFDQFTGATITPRAVVGAVRRALLFAQENSSVLFEAKNDCAPIETASKGQ
ncbi:electron transport complex subunit RsxG [Alteromonas aestuariivivens]|uniref:Ion-translocating oxidoreductase complex subunit G n=1 Tax=Alteromonas aestuariivivens TaxID=1938339 RepID=A0A3D8M674_9ALTE|nr:electron transport complex subunit RsxG [Alteromonas aestuariivivens]RDV25179.1 electron transport complex subunit RsxG [Alteromonas aestuariivivens]